MKRVAESLSPNQTINLANNVRRAAANLEELAGIVAKVTA